MARSGLASSSSGAHGRNQTGSPDRGPSTDVAERSMSGHGGAKKTTGTRAIQAAALLVTFGVLYGVTRVTPELETHLGTVAAIGFLLLAGTLMSELLETIGRHHRWSACVAPRGPSHGDGAVAGEHLGPVADRARGRRGIAPRHPALGRARPGLGDSDSDHVRARVRSRRVFGHLTLHSVHPGLGCQAVDRRGIALGSARGQSQPVGVYGYSVSDPRQESGSNL